MFTKTLGSWEVSYKKPFINDIHYFCVLMIAPKYRSKHGRKQKIGDRYSVGRECT